MALRFEVSEQVPPPQWDDELRAAGGTIFHSSAWAEYIAAAQRNCSPLFLRLLGEAGPVAFALAFHECSRRRLLAPFTSRVWLDSRPVAVAGDQENMMRMMLAHLESLAHELGALELVVGSFASADCPPALETLGYTTRRRIEFEFQLQRPDEVLLEAMDPARRRKIKKAYRMGVTVVELDPDTGVPELRRLQSASSARIVQRGGPRTDYRGEAVSDPVRVLLARGTGKLAGAVVDGQLVSAGLFIWFGPLVYHALGGEEAKAFETQAPTLLIWEMLRRFREQGAQRFSLGGCSADAANAGDPEHGVYRYKQAFGATSIKCTSGTRCLRPVVGRAVSTLRVLAGARWPPGPARTLSAEPQRIPGSTGESAP